MLAGLLCIGPAYAGEKEATFGTWIAYWDIEAAIQEVRLFAPDMNALVYFGAFFDTEEALFLPVELSEAKPVLDEIIEGTEIVTYLSIINDLTIEDDTYSQKDVQLLYRLLATPESRLAHIKDILGVALALGCDGIEIDYERIGTDLALWELFLAFLEELQAVMKALDMPLRVLLQPDAPTDQLNFPVGCEYVMMCYNLYGTHSGPGPKADEAFLQSMVARMQAVPQPRGFALATGGFDWSDEGVQQLTQLQAEVLCAEQGAVVERDAASNAVWYEYVDDAGMRHAVWYTDGETLAFWAGVLGAQGESDVDIWRLGGNVSGEE